MKKILWLTTAFCIINACSENGAIDKLLSMESINDTSVSLAEIDTPYSFESVTTPEIWETFNNLEEMQNACQIPADILKKMSTKALIQTCMNYPLYGNYIAYNNELDGIRTIIKGFNGFEELQRRTDAAEQLLAYYDNLDIKEISQSASFSNKNITILHLGYFELLLGSGFIPSIYSEPYITKLEEIRNRKYEDKLSFTNIYSMETIKKSLLIGAQIKLTDGALTKEEKQLLSSFVNNGGDVDSAQDYSVISKILIN